MKSFWPKYESINNNKASSREKDHSLFSSHIHILEQFSLVNSVWSVHISLLIQMRSLFACRKSCYGQRTFIFAGSNSLKLRGKEREREVVCGQVWWPILGICPLHLTHPSAHSQQWTHTRSSGQPYCGARGAVGGSVPCSRVSPQSWYWRWREHLLFTPPTDNPCRTWESNLQPLGYKSNSLTIRPRLP